MSGNDVDQSLMSPLATGSLAPLTRDATFKRAFGDATSDISREALLHLFNSVNVAGRTITSIAEINPVEYPSLKGRTIIYDILCKLDNGETVVVELQKAQMRDQISDRLVGYVARLYNGQWKKGGGTEAEEGGYSLVPVHALALLDFRLDEKVEDSGDMVQHFASLPRPGFTPSKAMSARMAQLNDFTVVQMPLAPKQLADSSSDVEKWAHLIHYSSKYTMNKLPQPLNEGIFRKVAQTALYENLSSKEREDIEAENAFLRQREAQLAHAENARAAAEQKAASEAAARAAAETARAAAEQQAASEAAACAAAETARAAAETARAAAETARAAAEQQAASEAAACAAAEAKHAAAEGEIAKLREQLENEKKRRRLDDASTASTAMELSHSDAPH